MEQVTAPRQSSVPHAPYTDPGAADFKIGLAPIAHDAWFEPLHTDPATRKPATEAEHPAITWRALAGSEAGQAEVLAMICAWAGRTPHVEAGLPALRAAARLVDDDLLLMERREGEWTLTAASLCSPTYFSAVEAVGKSLTRLHAPVPRFGDRFLTRVARIFDTLAPDIILQRRNWSVLNAGTLFLPDPEPVRARLAAIDLQAAGRELFVRMERQTLRRLPRTGGLLFTIRIWSHTLDDLRADPGRLAAFAAAWAAVMGEGGADVQAYKKLELYDPLVRAFLKDAGG
jgi:hypothetical protein